MPGEQLGRPRLRWAPGQQVVDPLTGIVQYQRPGLAWTVAQAPPQQVVSQVWQPRVVAQQVQVTQYVPQQVVENVPVQVCRYVPEERVHRCRSPSAGWCKRSTFARCRSRFAAK